MANNQNNPAEAEAKAKAEAEAEAKAKAEAEAEAKAKAEAEAEAKAKEEADAGAKEKRGEVPAWQKMEYDGPLSADQAEFRNQRYEMKGGKVCCKKGFELDRSGVAINTGKAEQKDGE